MTRGGAAGRTAAARRPEPRKARRPDSRHKMVDRLGTLRCAQLSTIFAVGRRRWQETRVSALPAIATLRALRRSRLLCPVRILVGGGLGARPEAATEMAARGHRTRALCDLGAFPGHGADRRGVDGARPGRQVAGAPVGRHPRRRALRGSRSGWYSARRWRNGWSTGWAAACSSGSAASAAAPAP